jgi:hypothetical protein
MFFDQSQPYARVPEPGDSSRILLVQGDIALWEGWAPGDAFETPEWAKTPAEDTQIPLDAEARATKMSTNLKGMKAKLVGAAEELKRPKSAT